MSKDNQQIIEECKNCLTHRIEIAEVRKLKNDYSEFCVECIEWVKQSKKTIEEKIYEELGYISSIFMSQGDTRAGDIIMPSEELKESGEKILSFLEQALTFQKAELKAQWKKEIEGIKKAKREEVKGENLVFSVVEYNKLESYNQALSDILKKL